MSDFTTRFNELLARFSGSDHAIAEALGVSKQTISAWKNGTRFPKRPAVRTIAEFFGVSVPWLEGITDDPTACAGPLLPADPQEEELLEIYRGLNAAGQGVLMGTARGLACNEQYKKGSASNTETA